ncbi:MAG: hypothetical protein AABZ06_11575 [Bdellovibrionota bacterium]
MKKNEKFLSIKGPLDFFTPEECERFKAVESVFIPQFIDLLEPFFQAGRRTRRLFEWSEKQGESTGELSPPPFELSDAVLKIIGPLWRNSGNGGIWVEPFFVSAFTEKFCDPLPQEVLQRSRNQNMPTYERGVLLSSLGVFLGLHLGYCDFGFLNSLRKIFFDVVTLGPGAATCFWSEEIESLFSISSTLLDEFGLSAFEESCFEKRPDRVSVKLWFRLGRIRQSLATIRGPLATVFGEQGIVDAG